VTAVVTDVPAAGRGQGSAGGSARRNALTRRGPAGPASARAFAWTFAWILSAAAAAANAQKADSGDAAAKDRSYPWIAHSSLDVFYQHTPAQPGRPYPYQASLYQGFTIQSLSFAWFHLGLRTRETYAYGFEEPYQEPMVLKLQGSAELLPGLAYASLGGNIPLMADKLDLGDTMALYQSLNGYSPFPGQDFLSPTTVQAAVFGRYAWANLTGMAGASYARRSLYRGLPEQGFYPASYFDLFARFVYQGAAARHRLDGRASLYGSEETDQRIPAHAEGDLFQLRYEWLKSLRKVGWQLGAGAAGKPPDKNRRIKLKSELEPARRDENLQRAYGEAAVTWVPSPDILWRAHLLPKAVFGWNGEHSGYEAEAGLTLGLRVWEYHRFRATGTLLTGEFDGRQYLGFGIRAEFAFRHLGIQDLDEGPEPPQGE
jgi:hypothetical protein